MGKPFFSLKYDLTGQKFGAWTVLSRDKDQERTARLRHYATRDRDKPTKSWTRVESMWLCQCHCGTKRTVSSYSLRKGKSKSCGCAKNGEPKSPYHNSNAKRRVKREAQRQLRRIEAKEADLKTMYLKDIKRTTGVYNARRVQQKRLQRWSETYHKLLSDPTTPRGTLEKHIAKQPPILPAWFQENLAALREHINYLKALYKPFYRARQNELQRAKYIPKALREKKQTVEWV